MKIKVISYGKNRTTLQIVIHWKNTSVTKHLKLVSREWVDKFGIKYTL